MRVFEVFHLPAQVSGFPTHSSINMTSETEKMILMTMIVVWGILVMDDSAAIQGFPHCVFHWRFTLDQCLLEECMEMLQRQTFLLK